MAQVSLYIEDSMAERLTSAAKNRNCSISKYVSSLISENFSKEESEEKIKKQILAKLCGAIKDSTFTIPSELSWNDEIPRRFDLI